MVTLSITCMAASLESKTSIRPCAVVMADDQTKTARSLRLGERRPLRTLVSQGNV